jgi:hypothetical protein
MEAVDLDTAASLAPEAVDVAAVADRRASERKTRWMIYRCGARADLEVTGAVRRDEEEDALQVDDGIAAEVMRSARCRQTLRIYLIGSSPQIARTSLKNWRFL